MIRTVTGEQLGQQVFLGQEPSEGLLKSVPADAYISSGNKPHGYGLWTSSPSEHISDWCRWCSEQDRYTGQTEKWLLTPKADALLAEIDSYEDLEQLVFSFGRAQALAGFVEHRLNFHAIAQHYAGVHLTKEGERRTRITHPLDLYTWDCESTLWLKWAFDKVECGGVVYVGQKEEDDEELAAVVESDGAH